MSDLQKIIYLTKTQYDTLAGGGTVGSLTGLNDEYLYCTTNDKILTDDLANDFVLPVANGGTGLTTSTNKNAVIIGNSTTPTNAFQAVRTASGAFYATAQDGAPSFGILPVAQGGSGTASFTANSAIISGSTSTAALTTRAITDVTTAATNPTANTNLITANTLMNYKGTTNIDTLGTVTSGTWSATTIAANKGGTGQDTYTVGDMLYCGTANTLSKLAGNTTTTNKFLCSVASTSGTAVAPSWATLVSDDIPELSTDKLTSGILPIARGGTNNNTFEAGRLLYYNSTSSNISSSFLKYNIVNDINYIHIMPANTDVTPVNYINQDGIIQGSSLRVAAQGINYAGLQFRSYDSTGMTGNTYNTFTTTGTSYSWGAIYCQVPCTNTAGTFQNGPQMYFLLRSKANSSSTATTTNGYAEYYYLPRPADALTASQTYYIYTTKDAYKIVSYTATISVSAGKLVNISYNNLNGGSAPSGYSPVAITRINPGNSNISVVFTNAQATGDNTVVCLRNQTTSNNYSVTGEIRILYLHSS